MQTLRITMRVVLLAAGLCLALLAAGEGSAHPLTASVSVAMSNPACMQASPNSGVCQITFGNITAAGSDNGFSRLEVSVDGKLRARVTGFFESSAVVFPDMLGGGLQVACGGPNAGGIAGYGKSYILQAAGYMGGGESGSAQTTVLCPYYDGKTFIPLLSR